MTPTDAGLAVNGAVWTRIGPVAFAAPDGPGRIAFVDHPTLGWTMATGARTYRRIPWVASAAVQLPALAASTVALVVAVAVGPVVAAVRRRVGGPLAVAWGASAAALVPIVPTGPGEQLDNITHLKLDSDVPE
ncbi:MAG: hypothetical protein ABMB14_37295, partial [Myxococcota bacterium]